MADEKKESNLTPLPKELVDLIYTGPIDEDLKEAAEVLFQAEDTEERKGKFLYLIMENYKRVYNKEHNTDYSIQEIIEAENLTEWILFTPDPEEKPKKSLLAEAREKGSITNVGNNQISVSNKNFMYALTTKPNKYAFISRVGKDFFSSFGIDENGQSQKAQEDKKEATHLVKTIKEGTKQSYGLDTSFLRQFLTAVHNSRVPGEKNDYVYTIYLPTFCREMGQKNINYSIDEGNMLPHDIEENNMKSNFWEQVHLMSEYIGVLKNNSYWKVLDIIGYDEEQKTLTIVMPYFPKLFQAIDADPETKVRTKKGEVRFIKESYHSLLHSDVTKAKDQVAVEIANYIICGLMQRGTTKSDADLPQNKKKAFEDRDLITWRTKAETILNEVQELKKDIESITSEKGAADIKKKQGIYLKRHFANVEKVLSKYSDVYKYYKDFAIIVPQPTMTTLQAEVIVTHHGIKAEYKK